MTAAGKNLVVAACVLAMAGCSFGKKERVPDAGTAIEDMKLTMSCTFEGESVPSSCEPPAVYSISGSFTNTGAELGHTFRDEKPSHKWPNPRPRVGAASAARRAGNIGRLKPPLHGYLRDGF